MSEGPPTGAQVVAVNSGIWTTLPNDSEAYHLCGYAVNVWCLPDGTVGTMPYQQVRGFIVRAARVGGGE